MRDVEQFLYTEAALLDAQDYPGWLKLFASDGKYWIPAHGDHIDPTKDVSIVYDDTSFLAERVWRMDSGLAYAQEPRSKTAHLITNVQVLADEEAELDVTATFLVAEYRNGTQHHYPGHYRYQLRRIDGDFEIVLKKVELISNDGWLGNLSLLL